MSVLLAVLGKTWPYLLAAAIAGGVATWLTHKADAIGYGRLQNEYSGYQLKVADAERDAQKAAHEALQAQIDQQHTVDRNNEQVMNDLRKRTADAESHYDADRAFISGMLNSASKAAVPASGPLPQAHGDSGAAAASGTSGAEQVAQLCADTKAEDERNADRLDSIIAELKPQL